MQRHWLSFKNILLSNMQLDHKSYMFRKVLMSNILLYVAMIIFPSFTLIHLFMNHNSLIVMVDFLLFVLTLIAWHDLRRNKNITRTSTFTILLSMFGIIAAVIASKGSNFVALWSMIVPFVVFILKGHRLGLYYIIPFYIVLSPLLYIYTIDTINTIQAIRFSLISIVILLVAYFFERTVSITFRLLQKSHEEISHSNTQIASSIQYATNIQKSFLAPPTQIEKFFPQHLLIWLPKDTVSGDLYIYEEYSDGVLFGVADCTGHGVPGGFMTILAGSNIKRIAAPIFYNPAQILQELNCAIKDQLRQHKEEGTLSNDGLDIGLCFIPKDHSYAIYAGAKIDLISITQRDNNYHLEQIKSDKQSIGYKKSQCDYEYHNHKIELQKGQSLYLYSDGFIDQVGGEKGFCYSCSRFKKFLLTIQTQPMEDQKSKILQELDHYQGKHHRRDDITIFGVKV